jgi:hypothetical protein
MKTIRPESAPVGWVVAGVMGPARLRARVPGRAPALSLNLRSVAPIGSGLRRADSWARFTPKSCWGSVLSTNPPLRSGISPRVKGRVRETPRLSIGAVIVSSLKSADCGATAGQPSSRASVSARRAGPVPKAQDTKSIKANPSSRGAWAMAQASRWRRDDSFVRMVTLRIGARPRLWEGRAAVKLMVGRMVGGFNAVG